MTDLGLVESPEDRQVPTSHEDGEEELSKLGH